ncbi:MAK10-like protein [Tanacetum coccineum]
MVAHTERMEEFEKAVYRKREEINERMTKMFSLVKEYTNGRAPEKVLIQEEGRNLVTKYVNAISLIKKENEEVEEYDEVVDIEVVEQSEVLGDEEVEEYEEVNKNELDRNGDDNPTRWGKYADKEYYLKHDINRKTIEDLVDNHEYNDALRKTQVIGKSKFMNALADLGSDVNIMPLTIYNKLTSEKPLEINVRLSLANYSYVYTVGIAEDVLVEVVSFMCPADVVILDIEENEYMPLIQGTPFLTTAGANNRCSDGSMTFRARGVSDGCATSAVA